MSSVCCEVRVNNTYKDSVTLDPGRDEHRLESQSEEDEEVSEESNTKCYAGCVIKDSQQRTLKCGAKTRRVPKAS